MRNSLTISLLTSILLLLSINSFGQSCNCLENFEDLEMKVENDYAGFTDKVNEWTKPEYEKHTEFYRKRIAETTTTQKCVLLMKEWLGFFNDKHLSISVSMDVYWTFTLIDSNTLLFRIPDFTWSSKPIIDSLIRTNYDLIAKTPILIIDLRGNGGGIDYSYLELLPFLYTHPYESMGVEWLASEGNIELFENSLKTGNVRKGHEEDLVSQVSLMKANQGSFIATEVTKTDTVLRDSVFMYPQKVGLIVNDFCASTCEQFILDGKNSSKTTVFGTYTLGVLDYSNSVPVSLPMENLSLRYPMTRSQRLPDYPIDNIGIEPDVEINLPENLNLKSDIDDWVLFVKDYLEKELEKE